MKTTKICPRCAEEIQAAARVCRYCRATFDISLQGYCTNCHAMRQADEQQHCTVCRAALADVQIVSRLIEDAPPPTAPAPLPQAARPAHPPKARQGLLRRLVLVLVLVSISAVLILLQGDLGRLLDPLAAGLQGVTLTSTATFTPIPSETPRPSRTPSPTDTPWPTSTSTPAPEEVSFDSINSYDPWRLVILVGRLDLMSSTKCTTQGERTTCGLLLENPDDPDQKITIFVEVGDGPNQMKALPETYTKSDIQVQLDDGTLALVGYRLRVYGRVCTTTVNTACISDVYKIELVQLK